MGSGTDVTLETADTAVLHGRVGDAAAMIADTGAIVLVTLNALRLLSPPLRAIGTRS